MCKSLRRIFKHPAKTINNLGPAWQNIAGNLSPSHSRTKGTLEKIKQPKSLLSCNEEVYVSKEVKVNALDSHQRANHSEQKLRNCRKSICGVSRPLSMKREARIMHICSVIIYPLEKKFIGASSILAGGKSRVLPAAPFLHTASCQVVTGTAVIWHPAGRQNRQYVFPLNIIYNVLS